MDRPTCFLVGAGLGLAMGVLALLATAERQAPMVARDAQITKMIEQCEAPLPRNETCVLVARKKEV